LILPEHQELEKTVNKLSQQLAEEEIDDFFEKMGIIYHIVEKYAKLNSTKAPNIDYTKCPDPECGAVAHGEFTCSECGNGADW